MGVFGVLFFFMVMSWLYGHDFDKVGLRNG